MRFGGAGAGETSWLLTHASSRSRSRGSRSRLHDGPRTPDGRTPRHVLIRSGPGMALGWVFDGYGMALEWLMAGSGMAHGWLWDGTGVTLGWPSEGSGMAPCNRLLSLLSVLTPTVLACSSFWLSVFLCLPVRR